MESDSAYFARRAHEERVAASSAIHPIARRSHEAMADRYEQMALAISAPLELVDMPRVATL